MKNRIVFLVIMTSDKPNEFIHCIVCQQNFDIIERIPRCYMPCGHTLCSKCVEKSTDRVCSACNENINQVIPDYAAIDSIQKASHSEIKIESKTETKQTFKPIPKRGLTKNMKGKMLAFMKSDQV